MHKKENKYITMLYKKHPIGKNEFIYKPNRSIIVLEENNTFYDYNNNEYYSLIDEQTLDTKQSYSIDPYVFFYSDYKEAFFKETKHEITDNEMTRHFYKEFKNKYYYVKYEKEQFFVSSISISNEENNIEIEEDLNEIEYDVELIKNIEEGNYSKEELEEIKDDIKYRKIAINELDERITEAQNKYNLKLNKSVDEYEKRGLINIEKLYKQITKTLISQDEAAKEFITELAMLDLDNSNKKGILLTGDTGVGKTKLVELVSKYLNRPFLIIDSTQLTMPGYVGKDIEEYLYELLENCNFDLDLAEHAIVFFDEIDKKGSSKKGDVSGQGVLNQLLKFLDGETYIACQDTKDRKNTAIEINTSNMIVIAGGAFTDVYHSTESNKISGFNQNKNDNIKNVDIEDFVNKAQMPREFIGRCSIVHLNNLYSKDYEKILRISDESPIVSAQKRFDIMDSVKLNFTDDYFEKCSKLAESKKVGVRGLNGIVIKSISEPFRHINKHLGKYKEVILDSKVLENNNDYKLIEKEKVKQKIKN